MTDIESVRALIADINVQWNRAEDLEDAGRIGRRLVSELASALAAAIGEIEDLRDKVTDLEEKISDGDYLAREWATRDDF